VAILVISSALPVAPSAASVAARLPSSAASTSSAPGAGAGPPVPGSTPMMMASAVASRADVWLVSKVVVTAPMLVPARPGRSTDSPPARQAAAA
jgi:hypothetical protein